MRIQANYTYPIASDLSGTVIRRPCFCSSLRDRRSRDYEIMPALEICWPVKCLLIKPRKWPSRPANENVFEFLIDNHDHDLIPPFASLFHCLIRLLPCVYIFGLQLCLQHYEQL